MHTIALNLYVVIFFAFLWQLLHSKQAVKLDNSKEISKALKPLSNICVDNILSQHWWAYAICFEHGVKQMHFDFNVNQLKNSYNLGAYLASESTPNHQKYRDDALDCAVAGSDEKKSRITEVDIECCGGDTVLMKATRQSLYNQKSSQSVENMKNFKPLPNLYIHSVEEPTPCSYRITVCSELMCKSSTAPTVSSTKTKKVTSTTTKSKRTKQTKASSSTAKPVVSIPITDMSQSAISSLIPTMHQQNRTKEHIRRMFTFAYDSYMTHAFPEAELKPLSCEGGKFDLIKIPMVTLIDTLDTLVIMGNHSEFRRAVDLVVKGVPSFNLDVNVSLFETTIRVVGGLLSAHLMAIDPSLEIYTSEENQEYTYSNELLLLSIDLGERLLPAFNTKTGIPFGTVNLRYGVPTGETKIASTAGAGSLLVEFEILSYLSGNKKFGTAAFVATEALYARRSSIGLLGKHINTETGQWHEIMSGVGSNSDSFYEYLLKSYLLFRNEELYRMFTDTYRAIKRFVLVQGHWFTEVDMFSGKLQRKRVENLDAFWPGVEAMLGNSHHSANQLNTFYSVWKDLGFLPEEFDYTQYQLGNGITNAYYPLRPELIESTYHQYRTTGDRSWLVAGEMFLESIETHTKTTCGYASVSNLGNMDLEDTMPSFFLSETLKYLYLLFDEDNFIHHRPYIFSTEAHPFDSSQLFDNDIREVAADDDDAVDESSISMRKVNHTQAIEAIINQILPPEAVIGDGIEVNLPAGDGRIGDQSITKDMMGALQSLTQMLQQHIRAEAHEKKGVVHTIALPSSKEMSIPDEVSEKIATEAIKVVQLSPNKLLSMKCRKPLYWDRANSYDSLYLHESNRQARGAYNTAVAAAVNSQGSVDSSSTLSADSETLTVPQLITRSIGVVLDQIEDCNEAEEERMLSSIAETQSSGGGGPSKLSGKKSKKNKQKLEEITMQRRLNMCYPDEAPKASADAAVLKTVDINMGELGDFVVKVYGDGFIVTNKLEKNTIEISNVGKAVVLVRDYDNKKTVSKSITATLTGLVTSCQVRANVVGKGTLHWSRPCSVANFGMTKAVEVLSEIAIPQINEGRMCKTLEEYQAAKKKQWWQWSILNQQQQQQSTSAQLKVQAADESYAGKIVLVNRGECLFEEKAVIAKKEGAIGMIVRNNEDSVFIMAGKREVEAASKASEVLKYTPVKSNGKLQRKNTADATESTLSTEGMEVVTKVAEEPVPVLMDIPTVMLAKSDADKLIELVASQQALAPLSDHTKSRNARVKRLSFSIDITAHNMLLNTEFMGNFDYPKVWVKSNLVFVIGSGKWGTFVTSTTGEDWQLYLMARKDMTASAIIPSVTIMDENNLPVSVTSNVLTNAVDLYAFTIARKCPNVFQMNKQDGILRLKR